MNNTKLFIILGNQLFNPQLYFKQIIQYDFFLCEENGSIADQLLFVDVARLFVGMHCSSFVQEINCDVATNSVHSYRIGRSKSSHSTYSRKERSAL